MCVEMRMRAPSYSKVVGSRTATRINSIKICLEVENSWENKQSHGKEVHHGPWPSPRTDSRQLWLDVLLLFFPSTGMATQGASMESQNTLN